MFTRWKMNTIQCHYSFQLFQQTRRSEHKLYTMINTISTPLKITTALINLLLKYRKSTVRLPKGKVCGFIQRLKWQASRPQSAHLPLAFIRIHQMAQSWTVVTTCSCSLLLICQPRKDERLSWPNWLTYSEWFTHINGSPVSCRSSAGQRKLAGQRPTFYLCATNFDILKTNWIRLFFTYLWNDPRSIAITRCPPGANQHAKRISK